LRPTEPEDANLMNESKAQQPRKKRSTRELVFIIAGLVVMTHGTSMVTVPLLPRYVDVLGGTVVSVGLSMGIYAAARLFMNIPAGMMAERFGRRWVIIAGALGAGLFASLAGTSSNVTEFLAYRFMLGIFSSMAITISSVAITDITTVANRGRTLSIVSGAHLAVGIAAPGLGGIAAEFVGIRVPFYASGVGALLVGLWAIVRLPETKTSDAPVRDRKREERRSSWADTRTLLGNRSFLLVCLVGFSHFFARNGGSHTLIPLFADRVMEMSTSQLGVFFSIASLLHGVMVYPAGIASDRFGRKILLVPGGLITAAALAAFPFSESIIAFTAAFMVLHIASGFSGGAPNAYVGDLAPAGMRGLGFGIFRTFGDLAGVISPIALTALTQEVSFESAFLLAAALSGVLTIAFWRSAVETAGTSRKVPGTESPPAEVADGTPRTR